MRNYEHLLDQLKQKDVEMIRIEKDEFMSFRQVLLKREDFKHFRGIAKQGGIVEYTYLDSPRS